MTLEKNSHFQERLVGSLVGGRYLVDQEIGAGGISTVYLARDLQAFGRNVVVKVLQKEFEQDEYIVKKFRQEAEALSRVDHPNVVSIHGRGELDGGRPYIILQYVKGTSLRDIIAPGGIDLERAATIIRWVAHALTATHEAGVLHRDLKPENVMLQPFGDEERVVVIDFGIAQVKDSVIGRTTSVTSTVGTLYYMSPEQLGGEELTPASDTYALGIIAYELVTGRQPFAPRTAYQLLDEQRAGVAVSPGELRPELPAPAQDAILRALSFDPAERQPRTRDFGNELYRSLSDPTTRPLGGETGELRHYEFRVDEMIVRESMPTGYMSAVFPTTSVFFKEDSKRFDKIEETFKFYQENLNTEFQRLSKQADVTFILWCCCVFLGFCILITGLILMFYGKLAAGTVNIASTGLIYFIQKIFQQREDQFRELASKKRKHLEYGNKWLMVIQTIDAIADPVEKRKQQAALVSALINKLRRSKNKEESKTTSAK
jgi:serine/threonine protein kinase